MTIKSEWIPSEDLKVGDTVKFWFGTKTIVAFEPYHGPIDCVKRIVRYTPGADKAVCGGISDTGEMWERVIVKLKRRVS